MSGLLALSIVNIDKSRTEHGHLAFHFDPVGRPAIFFLDRDLTFVNPA